MPYTLESNPHPNPIRTRIQSTLVFADFLNEKKLLNITLPTNALIVYIIYFKSLF